MANTNMVMVSYQKIGSSRTSHGLMDVNEVELEECPFTTLSSSSAFTLESGKSYSMIPPSTGVVFTVPAVTDTSILHNILVFYDTFNTTNIAFKSSTTIQLNPAGVQNMESGKNYVASLTYIPYRSASAETTQSWKWVLTITENIITTTTTS